MELKGLFISLLVAVNIKCVYSDVAAESGDVADCPTLMIVDRDSIPLLPGRVGIGNGLRLVFPINTIVILETTVAVNCVDQTSCEQEVVNEQNYYMNTINRNDIPYNFLIGDDGNVYEGRGWQKIGSHSAGINTSSYGVAFIGDFENTAPSNAAQTALINLITCGQSLGYIDVSVTFQAHPTATGELATYVNSLGTTE